MMLRNQEEEVGVGSRLTSLSLKVSYRHHIQLLANVQDQGKENLEP
jgi:hypothetical protein